MDQMNEDLVASSHGDGVVRVWGGAVGAKPTAIIEGHYGSVTGFAWTPEKSPKGPVSIIVSGADRTAYVYRNGVEIGRASVGGVERIEPFLGLFGVRVG